MRKAIRSGAVAAALLAAAWPFAGPARADEAATERRLKRIGVEKPLRDDVRRAIDRGVAFLAAQQRKDGVWADAREFVVATVAHGDGLNALCTLALVHADTQESRAAAKPALARLFPKDGSIAPQLVQTTYGAGIAAMLLHATRGSRDWAMSIAGRVANGRDPLSGTWNYRTGPAPTIGLQAPPHEPQISGPLNLSTTQFGVLALHAASLQGARVDDAVWTDVLNGHLAGQQSDGSWTYALHHPEWRTTYATGTLMGTADLVLAAQHLRALEDLGRGTSRARRVGSAISAARTALAADGVLTLWKARRGGGGVDGYALWSLEKACVFLGQERVDGVPWYADAARSLVTAQRADGSWGALANAAAGGDLDTLSTTAFALLILVRDIEAMTATTPDDEPPPAAITPGGPAVGGPIGVPAADDAVPIDVAAAAVARFRELVAARETKNAELLDLLRLFERAREQFAPAKDPKAPALDPMTVLRAIDAAILDGLFVTGEDPAGDEEGRRTVNRRAAELLAAASDATLAAVRSRLEKLFKAGAPTDGPHVATPYRPAFELLAARGGAETFAWMLEASLHDDLVGDRGERALAFLLAVPKFAKLPGAVRVEAAKDIANRYVGRETASAGVSGAALDADPVARMRWSRFHPRVVEALLALARDPKTGAEPRDKRGHVPLAVDQFAAWLRDHDDPRRW